MKHANVSVLMSVYFKENPQFLSEAMESIIQQTKVPRQFVIVCDGYLPNTLEEVLKRFFEKYKTLLEITLVRVKHRKNLGVALNYGLAQCKYPLIARMDSDDHALPDRIALQENFFARHPESMVLGGTIQEYVETWETPVSYRKVPIEASKIFEFSRKRNPLNHMTVMFKRDFINNVMHGYHDVPGYEDYELWLRVLNRDAMAISNLPQVLVAARVSGLQSRRGGFKYVLQNIRARSLFFDEGLISLKDLIVSIAGGTVVGLCPEAVRKVVYKKVLRG